ncbi:peroxiredoxin [Actinoplanes sp. NPDC020271]|uniref:peroxiredoxin n=1 Tax=Actinoplanes sp. NPDC020271 TaxID=3363896 RepID=UPI00378C0E7C
MTDSAPTVPDSAAGHDLIGAALPALALPASDGCLVDLGALGPGRTVIYLYPLTGRPGVPQPAGFEGYPGARGCTAESRDFRDHYTDLRNAGISRIFGLSGQDSSYQQEVVERLRLPFVLLSDSAFRLADDLGLPTFVVDGGLRFHTRTTLIVHANHVEHVFSPVEAPEAHAQQVLDWVRSHL